MRYLEPRSDEDLLQVIRSRTVVQTRYRLTRRPDRYVVVWRAHERETAERVAMPPSGLVFDTVEGA